MQQSLCEPCNITQSAFQSNAVKTKTKVTAMASQKKGNITRNQSRLEVNTCKRPEVQKNARNRVLIDFGFASDWLRGWCKISGPITEHIQVKRSQSWITFDTQLKIAQGQIAQGQIAYRKLLYPERFLAFLLRHILCLSKGTVGLIYILNPNSKNFQHTETNVGDTAIDTIFLGSKIF